MDLRTLLAAVLGVGLGLLFVVYPEVVVRTHTTGRRPTGRGSEYGADSSPPTLWRRLVQIVGVVVTLMGLYFGVTLLP